MTAAKIERIFWEFPRPKGLRLGQLTITRLKLDSQNGTEWAVLSNFGP